MNELNNNIRAILDNVRMMVYVDSIGNNELDQSEVKEATKAIEALITEQVRLARDSERNRVLAELRHFGYKHDAKKMMKLRKEWEATAAKLKDTTLLEGDK